MSNSLFFGAAISLIAYEAGLLLKRKFKMAIFNPLLIAIITSSVTISPRITAIVLESLRLSFLPVLCVVLAVFVISLSSSVLYRTYFPNIYSLFKYNTTPYPKMKVLFEHLFVKNNCHVNSLSPA